MNEYTGEIKTQPDLLSMFQRKPEEEKSWFSIDRMPQENCVACEGQGFVGRHFNHKVIPCVCVFDDVNKWTVAVMKQRDLKRRVADPVLYRLRGEQ